MSVNLRFRAALIVLLGFSFVLSPFSVLAQTVSEPEIIGEAEENPEESEEIESTPLEEEVSAETGTSEEILAEEEVTIAEETQEEEEPALTEEQKNALIKSYSEYSLYMKWEKYDTYKKYERYQELAYKYPWETTNKKLKKVKEKLKKDYKKWKKKPSKYPQLAGRASDYQNFESLKSEYFSLKPYAGYAHYAQFNKGDYEHYKKYGTDANKAGYEEALAKAALGELTLPTETQIDATTLGPKITVGIYNVTPSDLRENAFRIRADKPFKILSKNDNLVAEIPAHVRVKVKYIGDKTFSLEREDTGENFESKRNEVRFVPLPEYETETIFDVNRPGSSFDKYRDGIRLRYYDSPVADGDRVWVINVLPLEHYVWGMGEITGTGPAEYNRVMTTIYRTYGQWKIQWSTKYADMGFKVDATSGSQIYYGYDWEVTHENIRAAAEATRGRVVMYENEVAITPYSSWTDGKTRRYEDGHWGHECDKSSSNDPSEVYPWLTSVSDTWGKHSSLSTCDLASRGNHMVGLSANGALNQAKQNTSFLDILKHYYRGVSVEPIY